MIYQNNQSGLIKFIVILVVIILILSFFRINLRGHFDDHVTIKENFSLVWNIAKIIWFDYVVRPAVWLWSEWVKPLFSGEPFEGIGEKMKEHSTID